MSKSKYLAGVILLTLTSLASQIALAGAEMNGLTNLPGPGIIGLIVAGVIGAIAVSRSKK